MKKIQGLDSLINKLNNLDRIKISDTVMRQIKLVQAEAKLNTPVKARGGGGELRDSIVTSVEDYGGGVRGIAKTNKRYAAYVELGTGPKGEADHDGISPKVNPSYSQHGWGIPADQIDAADAEMYHMSKRSYNGKEYYMTNGQAAHPFMYPAIKNNEKQIIKNVRKDFQGKIKKAVSK